MVQFPLEPGKPPVIFRFNVTTAQALEQAGGANPAYLASTGRQVTALVLMVWHGLQHADAGITERKAKRLVQRYLDEGGKIKPLMDALAKALEESGVYGDAEQGEDADEERPTTAATTPSD
jgi:hypothetical protein